MSVLQKVIGRWIVAGVAAATLSLPAGPAVANNLVVTNTTLQTPTGGKIPIQFDLSWDNSWQGNLSRYGQVSDRVSVGPALEDTNRNVEYGGRGARTAP